MRLRTHQPNVIFIYGIALICLALCSSMAVAQSTAASKGRTASTSTKREREAKAAFKRLLDLQAKLKRISMDDQEKEPHKSFLRANEKDIVYSDPSAEYYVRSDRFWDLQKKYKGTSIADDIAWTAAQNPMAGECEGDVNCYLYLVISTNGEYLKRYPKGKKSSVALYDVGESLLMMVEDLKTKGGFTWPTDAGERSEFTKNLENLRAIVKGSSDPNRLQPLEYIEKIIAELK